MPDNDTSMRSGNPTPPILNPDELIKALQGLVVAANAMEKQGSAIQSLSSELKDIKTFLQKNPPSQQDGKKSQDTIERTFKDLQSSVDQLIRDASSQSKSLERQLSRTSSKSAESLALTDLKNTQDSFIQQLQSLISSVTSTTDIESKFSELRQLEERRARSVQKSEDLIDVLKHAQEISQSSTRALEQLSPALAKRYEKSEKEQFEEQREETEKELQDSIDHFEKILEYIQKEINSSSGERKKQLEQSKKNIEAEKKVTAQQLKHVKDATYADKILKDAGNKLKDAGKQLLSSAANDVFNLLKNRYLDSYKKAFDTIYNSIESTRNAVSARLKLDSGAFKELEQSIYERINASELRGSISEADVNEMLVSFASAGITDTSLVEELSLLASELKASGSSFDLTNEETLREITSYIARSGKTIPEAMDDISQLVDVAIGSEKELTDVFGNTMALANGGFNTIINQILDNNHALGKTWEQTLTDVSDASYNAVNLATHDIDESVFDNILKQLREGTLDSASVLAQTVSKELNADTMATLSYSEQVSILYDAFKDIFAGQNISNIDIPYLEQVFGSGLTATDINKLRQSIDDINTYDRDKFVKNATDELTKVKDNLEEGNYLSKTMQVDIEKQNSQMVFDAALSAEQLYEGNKIVDAQYNGFISAIDSVRSAITELAIQSFTNGSTTDVIKTLSGKQLPGGGTVKDFMTGNTATTVGKVGTGLAYGYSVYELGKGVVDELRTGIEDGLAAEDIGVSIAGNKDVWGGVGAALGTAVAGPVGAMFGKTVGTMLAPVIGGVSEKLTDWATSGDVTGGINEVTSDLYDAASIQLEAAQKQIEAADGQIESLNKMKDSSNEEKKAYIIQQQQSGQLSQELSNELTEAGDNIDAILQVWEKYINEQKAEAEKQKMEAESKKAASMFTDKYSQNLANMATSIDSFDSLSTSTSTMQGYLGKEGTSELLSYIESYSGSTQQAISSLGLDESTSSFMNSFVKDLQKRKNNYTQKNYIFQNKWNSLVSSKGLQNAKIEDVIAAYSLEYMNNGEAPNIKVDDSGKPVLVEGLPVLDDDNGVYYYSSVADGKFKTGLTEVPYDNYAALLHQGERVLTKQEAEAYNKFSTYAMNALTNQVVNNDTVSGSNINQTFNTLQTKTGDVENAITSQTQTVQSLLKDVLQAINNLTLALSSGNKGVVNANILRMNTNLTQLNTLT